MDEESGNMHMQISEMLKAGKFDSIGVVAELKKSAYYDLLLKALDDLQTDRLYVSAYHGTDHVERVMLLGAIIAFQQHFLTRETELLLIACSYHDIGRIDDHIDNQHGKRSADELPSIPDLRVSAEEMCCIQAAVATHSTKDEMIDSFAQEYGVSEEYLGPCQLLCKGLKDADNLDRVRIHDLDIRHLRFDESKRMKKTAEDIYRIYKAPQQV